MSTIKNSLIIKPLALSDNLEEVAELIYKTDPYIYPYWFKNLESGRNVLVELIKTDGSVFNFRNILIAKIKNKIVGILIYLNEDSDLTFNYEKYIKINKHFKYTIKKYVLHLKDNIQNNVVYIPNVCVNEDFRNKKVATSLIDYLKKLYPKNDLMLHCLKKNIPALTLYNKTDFRIIKEFKGFNSPYLLKPKIYEMKYNILNK